MKMVKSLVLGSTAALFAMGGAQAADLPVKAKPVEYVRICSLYGAGFFYIPGTDTCIKLGGYLRADVTVNGGIYDAPFWNGEGAIRDRYANYYNARSRLALTVDTRTATEYGVVRTFGQADFQFSNFGSTSAISGAASVWPGGINGQVNNDTVGNGYVAVEMAFIQFAGFTFGKSASAYNTPWHGYPGNNTSFLVGGYDTVTGIQNVQYSWQFGNGVSLTLGVDDNSASNFNRTQIINAIGGAAGGSIGFTGACAAYLTALGCNYGGTSAPDFVGNIRVDQAWGLFQISGAAHQVHAGYNNTGQALPTVFVGGQTQANTIDFGHPSDKWGGAVSAALQIKNIPTGAGDDIKIEGSWSTGASKYVLGTSSADPSSFAIYNGTKLAMGVTTDAIYSGGPGVTPSVNPQFGLQLTRGWGFRGAFNHNWDPYWSTSLFGGIAGLSYNNTARVGFCNTFLLGGTSGITNFTTAGPFGTGITNCDPGFTVGMVGLVTRWTPVKNLTFSAEALWVNLHTKMAGSVIGTPSSALVLPTTTYTYGDESNYSLNLRVQRNF
jgi:Porin subfamily